ncbi:Iron-regulated protein FrpC [Nymphon striatum]|nr:Iron-regulated protein FrpC [Nymphon striatum]
MVAVANFKGGVGKTSTAAHLAMSAALDGYKVLVVDLDSQGSMTSIFGGKVADEWQTVFPLLARHYASHLRTANQRRIDLGEAPQPLDDTLSDALDVKAQDLIQSTHWPNIDLIGAQLNLYWAEFQIPVWRMQGRGWKLWDALTDMFDADGVLDDYDVIFIDTPPALGYLTINGLSAADILLVPLGASFLEFDSTGRFFDMLHATFGSIEDAENMAARALGKDGLRFEWDAVRAVVTRYDGAQQAELAALMQAYLAKEDAKFGSLFFCFGLVDGGIGGGVDHRINSCSPVLLFHVSEKKPRASPCRLGARISTPGRSVVWISTGCSCLPDLQNRYHADLDESLARLKEAREALTRYRTRTQIAESAEFPQRFVLAGLAAFTGANGGLVAYQLHADALAQQTGQVCGQLDVMAAGGQNMVLVGGDAAGGRVGYALEAGGSFGGMTQIGDLTAPQTSADATVRASAPGLACLWQGLGDVIHGGGLLEGGVLADLVTGRSSSDTLVGGAGNDTLRDGAGVDTLTGGAGNDVFVLDMDGARDVISDFRAGQDQLDLSFFWMLYDLSGLEIVSTSWGALLTWRGEETELHSFNGKSIGRAQVMSSVLPAGDRPPLVLADAPVDDGGDDGDDDGDDGGDDGGNVGDGGDGGDDTGGGTDGADTVGTSGNDSLVGTAAGETVAGFAGDDRIEGRGGNDHLTGGNGQDTILGETGNDEIHGHGGQDRILGGAGNDLIYGGIGFDTIEAGDGADTVWGGDGRDLILLNQGNDLFGDSAQNDIYGRDTVFGGFGADTLLGGGGDDELHGQFDNDSIQGGLGQDKLYGGTGFDTILGGAGNDTEGEYGRDTVRGGWGHDTLNGGAGDDELHGEADNDSVLGGAGHDRIYGGTGFDTVAAGTGNDTVWGGDGRDLIWLNQGADVFWDSGQNDANGNDTVFGGFGHDTLNGGGGADQLFGEIDNDSISGGIGSDILNGGDGYDTLRGGADNDTIYGGDRADQIFGDGGADVLVSGNGNDTLTGGAGADRFVFRTPDGFNRITDFTPGEDLIVMQVNETGFDQLTTQNWAKGLLLEWDGGQVLLEGVTAGQFQPADVVFE